MEEQDLKIELPPDIFNYLNSMSNDDPVSIKENNEEILFKVKAKTGLDIEKIEIVLNTIFQEIRNKLSSGESISLNPLGVLAIKKTTNSTVKFYPKFGTVVRRIRYGR
jgi:nucleoid DNA-binding protein